MLVQNRLALVLAAVTFSLALSTTSVRGAEPRLSLEQFDKLHKRLKPQPGESRWMEIEWHPNVWEGLQLAAAQGKPLFLWAGSGGAPSAGC